VKEGHLVMSKEERLRKCIVERVTSGELLQVEAAVLLGVSARQMKRICRRYRLEGDEGLVHGNRGRRSRRSAPEALREQVVARYEEIYEGIGPTLAAEKLAEEGLVIDHETLRRWLMAKGLWQRSRKRGPHRQRRPPKEHFGELVQLDGSHHAWFGPEHPRACLMSLVDDATGRCMTLLAEEETTEAAMALVQRWIERYGIPKALYADRKNVYITERAPTLQEQLAGEEPLTAFGKACKKLGILIITAHSPQAKGRVERKHGVYQDRFFHELRLRGITAIEDANRVLHEEFDEHLNRKFARCPLKKGDFHRPLPPRTDLRDIFCHEYTRVLANDWIIRYNGQILQVLKLNSPLPRPKAKITVRLWRDGTLHLLYGEHPLVFSVLDQAPPKQHEPAPPPKKPRAPTRSRYDHPWRRKAYTTSPKK
jgi:transposase